MRLTAEGNLGIGITHPQARLDVDGMIRVSQGIRFPDGTTQYSAASKTLGAKSTGPDQMPSGKHQFQIEAVTQNHIAKFTDNAGTLGDSGITETAGGLLGIGTSSPDSLLNIQGTVPSLLGHMSVIRTTGSNNGFGLLMDATGSGNNSLGLAVGGSPKASFAWDNSRNFLGFVNFNYSANDFSLRVNADGSLTYHDGASSAERFRVTAGGNVGIGSSNPLAALDVRGNLLLDNNFNPILYTSSLTLERNRYLQLINSPSFPSASGLKAGGVLVSDSYAYANPGKNDLIVKGNVGIGTANPTIAKLQVNDTSVGTAVYGNSTIATGVFGQASTALFGGVEGDNSATSGIGVIGKANAASSVGVQGRSDNGVGVNGISANGFAMRADGNTYQQRDKGGWVKAMVYLNRDGTIARCYNGLTASSSGNCGFTPTKGILGYYYVDFGFEVDDRFIVATSQWDEAATAASISLTFSGNQVEFEIHYISCGLGCSKTVGDLTDAPLFIIVF